MKIGGQEVLIHLSPEFGLFFLSFYPPWTDSGLKKRRFSSFLAFCRTMVQLGPKLAIFEPQQEGQTLTKFKNILYGIYWDQYQGFKTPAFWQNVFYQKAAPP
jgi:hypothetical protein